MVGLWWKIMKILWYVSWICGYPQIFHGNLHGSLVILNIATGIRWWTLRAKPKVTTCGWMAEISRRGLHCPYCYGNHNKIRTTSILSNVAFDFLKELREIPPETNWLCIMSDADLWIDSLLCQKKSELFWTHALFGRFTNYCGKKTWEACFLKKTTNTNYK